MHKETYQSHVVDGASALLSGAGGVRLLQPTVHKTHIRNQFFSRLAPCTHRQGNLITE